MRSFFNKAAVLFFAAVSLYACRARPELELLDKKEIPGFPSGSAMEFFQGRICLAGDDAAEIWIGDTAMNKTGSFTLIDSFTGRLPKPVKHDLEAAAIYEDEVLFLGSGSLSPYRYKGWLIDPAGNRKQMIHMDTFYGRLQANSIKQLNIEAAVNMPRGFLLAHRGNKSFPENYLVVTSADFLFNQEKAPIHLTRISANADTAFFNGISGMAYAARTDRLILSVTTEDTYSNGTDGAIGNSYLWVINDISKNMRSASLTPDYIIDLEKTDARFKGHKIESVCIIEEKKNSVLLMLVADDDNGRTVLFKARLKN
jgi:hypothetical protein